jgi:hypothetical protein
MGVAATLNVLGEPPFTLRLMTVSLPLIEWIAPAKAMILSTVEAGMEALTWKPENDTAPLGATDAGGVPAYVTGTPKLRVLSREHAYGTVTA